MRGNRKAKATFDALSPSHQREYVEWLTGANAGRAQDIKTQTAGVIVLQLDMPKAIQVGDTLIVQAGCEIFGAMVRCGNR